MKKAPATTKIMTSAPSSADSTGELVLATSTEPRADTRLIARMLGIQHPSIFAQVKTYRADFEEFGKVRFQTRPSPSGQAEKFALLNEDQAHLLLTYSRNTARVRALKVKLVKAFRDARRAATIRQTDYLPGHHDLQHGIKALVQGHPNERWFYINAAKAVNKAVGIEAGQRPSAALPTQSMLAVSSMLAAQAVRGASDSHQIQRRINDALQPIKSLTQSRMEALQ